MWSNDPSRGRWRSFLRRVGLGVFLGLLANGRPADAPIPIERDYTVRTWRKEHGLPDNRVLSLLVTRDGFLWAGTRTGAARFDGHKFEIWGHPTHAAFTNDTCRALAEGPDGRLWVATDEGMVVLGERLEWPLFTCGSSDPAAVSPPGPVAFRNVLATLQGRVLASSENGLWVGGDTNGWPSRALVDVLARVTITRLLQTADEAVWAGTDRQLYRLAPGANVWEPQFAEGAASETHYIHSLAAGGTTRYLSSAETGRSAPAGFTAGRQRRGSRSPTWSCLTPEKPCALPRVPVAGCGSPKRRSASAGGATANTVRTRSTMC